MSEETFKVQAKKPPSTRPTQKTDSKSKLGPVQDEGGLAPGP